MRLNFILLLLIVATFLFGEKASQRVVAKKLHGDTAVCVITVDLEP